MDAGRKREDRRITFAELAPTPKRERSATARKKTFQTHLLTSPENQLIIQKSCGRAKKTQEAKEKKDNLVKELVKKHKSKIAAETRAKRKIPIRGGPKL